MSHYIILVVLLSAVFILALQLIKRESQFTSRYGVWLVTLLNLTPILYLMVGALGLGWTQHSEVKEPFPLLTGLDNLNTTIDETKGLNLEVWYGLNVTWESVFLSISVIGLLYHLLAPIFVYKRISKTTKKVISGRLPIHLTEGVHTPFLVGFFRPVIVIPELLWDKMMSEERKAVLAHEMAHYKNGDHRSAWILQLSKGLFFWNPLFYVLLNLIKDAQEFSADSKATLQFKDKNAYAKTFLHILERYQMEKSHLVCMKISGSKKQNFRRLEKLCSPSKDRLALSLSLKWLLVLCMPILSMGLVFAAAPKASSSEDTSKADREIQIIKVRSENQSFMAELEASFDKGLLSTVDREAEFSETELARIETEREKLRTLLQSSAQKLGELEMLYCKAQLGVGVGSMDEVKKASCIECHSQLKKTVAVPLK